MTRILLEVTALTPQWSLTMEARKSRSRARSRSRPVNRPQWSLAMEARKRSVEIHKRSARCSPQWSLAMEARKSRGGEAVEPGVEVPAMEPGHGGQEEMRSRRE